MDKLKWTAYRWTISSLKKVFHKKHSVKNVCQMNGCHMEERLTRQWCLTEEHLSIETFKRCSN